jgi:hypothetical protein
MKRLISCIVALTFTTILSTNLTYAADNKTFKSSTGRIIKATTDDPDFDTDDIFIGNDRGIAKTSIPTVVIVESELALDIFISRLLKGTPDSYMQSKGISKDRESDRIDEEKRIVSVDAYICAAKKESDNDFHVILCTDPNKGNIQYFTAEVSGIPKHSEYTDDLIMPRKKFKSYFKNGLPGTKYDKYEHPLHVRVKGALFFDVDHKISKKTGKSPVGPKGMNPDTAWEIHPVLDIDFLD